mmetsp:Transcript_35382/g.43692  ORF Transcript_35382/g.43692 Transcript_35382/m.43692 type:complete len:116 (-) Transcript_35382:1152-1499(-)
MDKYTIPKQIHDYYRPVLSHKRKNRKAKQSRLRDCGKVTNLDKIAEIKSALAEVFEPEFNPEFRQIQVNSGSQSQLTRLAYDIEYGNVLPLVMNYMFKIIYGFLRIGCYKSVVVI